ncbi:MAG: IPT/TIG domain-containing protein, partial [Bryobacteraceae bacterium]
GFSGDGGPATSATLDWPQGVAADAAGNVYIADSGNNRVRKVDATGIITTYAGNGNWSGPLDDGRPAASVALNNPWSVAVDAGGNVYLTDGRIRKVAPNGIISTYAGNGNAGSTGDGGPATSAALDGPWGMAVDGAGNLYFAEEGSGRVRKVAGGSASTSLPFTGALSPSWAQAGGAGFTLTVSGINFVDGAKVTWDGAALTTFYVSANVLIASVPAELIATAGSHSIMVKNPAPSGGQTNPILFVVQPVVSTTPWISASPNPIPVSNGNHYGRTMLSWNAPGHNSVEVHMDSASGQLVATGGSSGSAPSYPYVQDGQQFFLVDPLTNETLASVTVTLLTDSRNVGTPERPRRAKQPLGQTEGGPPPRADAQPY